MSAEQKPPHSVRVYTALLGAYPKQFRREYGAQLEQLFRDLYQERCGSRSGLVLLWIRTLSDLVPTAVTQRIMSHTKRREAAMQNRRLAVIGFVLLLAPLYFVSASLLKYGLGVGLLFDPLEAFLSVAGRRAVFNVVSPVIFFIGLGLALMLNIFAVARFDLAREDGKFVGMARIEFRAANLAVVLASVSLLIVLVGYAFLENFAHRS